MKFFRNVNQDLERLLHGALLGVLVGMLAGLSEYFFLLDRSAFSDEFVQAYWEIVLPYTVVGLAGGVVTAVVVRLTLGPPASFAHHISRLLALMASLVLFSYVAIWATYQLGRPLLKFSNAMAYLGSAALAVLAAVLFYRIFMGAFAWIERGRVQRFRIGVPLVLGGLIPAAFLLPTLYLQRVDSFEPLTLSVAGQAQERKPNLIFIMLDALRADHLPMYGYSRQTAPNLAALAQKGAVLQRMYAHAPWTKPSIATIFSSLYPAVHKVTHDQDFLSDSVTVLPEILKAAGYHTFGVSASAYISPTFGYSQGFDEYVVWKTKSRLRFTMLGRFAEDLLGSRRLRQILKQKRGVVPRADAITGGTLKLMSQRGKDPFFLYVHYVDPHDPYRPPAPYDRKFDFRSDPPTRAGGVDPLKLLPKGQDPEQIGHSLDQYDGEILYTDYHVGRLLQGLKERGFLDNTIVMVTADHGEEFYEHGKPLHSNSLYEESLRVPLLVYWGDKVPAGLEYEGIVGHVDILPTLLSLMKIEAPAGIQGLSFAGQLVNPSEPKPERKLFAQVSNYNYALDMVRDGRYKLIRHVRGPREGFEELYDLRQDPMEKTNIAAQEKTQVAALRRELEVFNQWTEHAGRSIQSEKVQKLDKDTERALRALGYIK